MSQEIDEKKGKKLRIKIDRELCISVGSCVQIAAKTFQLDKDGLAYIVDPDGDDAKAILAAAQSCPTKAIFIYDEDGKQLWPKD